MTTSFSAAISAETVPALDTVSEPSGERVCQSGERIGVSQERVINSPMTDEEREAAAYRAGVAMQAWYSKYQSTGDPQALSIAHHHMTQMVSILAGRSPEQIARMEQERGLA